MVEQFVSDQDDELLRECVVYLIRKGILPEKEMVINFYNACKKEGKRPKDLL